MAQRVGRHPRETRPLQRLVPATLEVSLADQQALPGSKNEFLMEGKQLQVTITKWSSSEEPRPRVFQIRLRSEVHSASYAPCPTASSIHLLASLSASALNARGTRASDEVEQLEYTLNEWTQVLRPDLVPFEEMSGDHRRVDVRVEVGDSSGMCHLKPLDEGRVLGTLLVARPMPLAISPMISPDSERSTAPIPAGPVGSPSFRAAPSVYRPPSKRAQNMVSRILRSNYVQ